MTEKLVIDEGSRGGARSVLTFAIVAAALTVMLAIVGVRGRQVTPAPATAPAQSATEAPATNGSPAAPASGSTP